MTSLGLLLFLALRRMTHPRHLMFPGLRLNLSRTTRVTLRYVNSLLEEVVMALVESGLAVVLPEGVDVVDRLAIVIVFPLLGRVRCPDVSVVATVFIFVMVVVVTVFTVVSWAMAGFSCFASLGRPLSTMCFHRRPEFTSRLMDPTVVVPVSLMESSRMSLLNLLGEHLGAH